MPRIDRVELLLEIYNGKRHWYRNTRRLTSVTLMCKRLEEIKTGIQCIPPKKRSGLYKKRLVMEQSLIETKKMIYERKESGDRTKRSVFIENWLEDTDAKDGEKLSIYEKRRLKIRQTLLLMAIMYSNHDDPSLQRIVETSNKLLP